MKPPTPAQIPITTSLLTLNPKCPGWGVAVRLGITGQRGCMGSLPAARHRGATLLRAVAETALSRVWPSGASITQVRSRDCPRSGIQSPGLRFLVAYVANSCPLTWATGQAGFPHSMGVEKMS